MNILLLILFLIFGSFLNVCIYRIPRNESISFPPSHCPACSHRLGFWDLFPIVSYTFLRGRCRYCGERISIQYPLVEFLTATLLLLLYLKYGFSINFLKYSILTLLLIVVSFIDYHHKIIPNRLILIGLITGLISNTLYNFKGNILNGTIGLLIGGGLFLIIALVTRGAMGGGDIKLMAVLGLWLGWKEILLVSFLSFIVGAVISLVLLGLKIKGRKDYIPFGPFISIGAFVTIYYGTEILNWYTSGL